MLVSVFFISKKATPKSYDDTISFFIKIKPFCAKGPLYVHWNKITNIFNFKLFNCICIYCKCLNFYPSYIYRYDIYIYSLYKNWDIYSNQSGLHVSLVHLLYALYILKTTILMDRSRKRLKCRIIPEELSQKRASRCYTALFEDSLAIRSLSRRKSSYFLLTNHCMMLTVLSKNAIDFCRIVKINEFTEAVNRYLLLLLLYRNYLPSSIYHEIAYLTTKQIQYTNVLSF